MLLDNVLFFVYFLNIIESKKVIKERRQKIDCAVVAQPAGVWASIAKKLG